MFLRFEGSEIRHILLPKGREGRTPSSMSWFPQNTALL